MSPKQGRHRRGPGGPRRTSRSAPAAIPTPSRPGPELTGLVDPTLSQLVSTVVRTAGNAIDPGHPAPGVQLEQWALRAAATSFAPEAMPEQFYADLGRGLVEVDDPLAPAVLAALAVVVDHADADPLRRARQDWLIDHVGDEDADLGIGRETPVGAVTIDDTLVFGFASPGGDHTVGLIVDGPAADLWVGPSLDVVAADARTDPALTVLDVPLPEAYARVEAALAEADDDFATDDALLLPLLHRRLALIRT